MYRSRGPSTSVLDVPVTYSSVSDCAWQGKPQSCWAVQHFPPSSGPILLIRGPGYALGNCPVLSLMVFCSFKTWIHTLGAGGGWSLPIGVFPVLTLTSGTATDFPRNLRGLNTNAHAAYSLPARSLSFSSRLNALSLQQHSSSMHFEISFALYSAKRFHFFPPVLALTRCREEHVSNEGSKIAWNFSRKGPTVG